MQVHKKAGRRTSPWVRLQNLQHLKGRENPPMAKSVHQMAHFPSTLHQLQIRWRNRCARRADLRGRIPRNGPWAMQASPSPGPVQKDHRIKQSSPCFEPKRGGLKANGAKVGVYELRIHLSGHRLEVRICRRNGNQAIPLPVYFWSSYLRYWRAWKCWAPPA